MVEASKAPMATPRPFPGRLEVRLVVPVLGALPWLLVPISSSQKDEAMFETTFAGIGLDSPTPLRLKRTRAGGVPASGLTGAA